MFLLKVGYDIFLLGIYFNVILRVIFILYDHYTYQTFNQESIALQVLLLSLFAIIMHVDDLSYMARRLGRESHEMTLN